ncbi:MAG: hypothetical protein AAF573_22885, partial [Bacteroidota bacterium]
MGFFGEIKKLIFGAKAVGKSAADKATDYGKEKGSDFLDSADDILDKTKDKASDLGSTMMEKGSDLFDKAKDAASDFATNVSEKANDYLNSSDDYFDDEKDDASEYVEGGKKVASDVGGKILDAGSSMAKKAGEVGGKIADAASPYVEKAGKVAEDVGGKIIDATSPYVEKAGEVAENVGGVILDKGSDMVDKGKDVSEKVGGKILDAAGDMMDKAKNLGNTMMEKTNDLIEKANAEAAKESLDNQIDEAKRWDEKLSDHIKGKDVLDQKDPPIGYDKLNESLLDDKDSFWAKAEKYAQGDYSGEGKKETPPANDNNIFTNTEERQKKLKEDNQKAPFKGEIKGYEDHDGDGDPMIDDAII